MPPFIAALFDLSFDTFITPKIVTGIYIIEIVVSVIGWITFGLKGFMGGFFHGVFDLIIVAPIGLLLTLVLLRVGLELLMAIFKIAEYTKQIADGGAR
ncbi:MAG: DUF4282 domain-containing protein [Acidiferrobacteraceae bacterium]